LKNGIKVLLVSDQQRADQTASCAMSVYGAGQFADPADLPGLAHLMEHVILKTGSSTDRNRNFMRNLFNSSNNNKASSSSTASTKQQREEEERDFEDWLSDRCDGASNAFTAYDTVCFHFSCPESHFASALERFAGLFVQPYVEQVCRDTETLSREVRRVDAELLSLTNAVASTTTTTNSDDRVAWQQARTLTRYFANPEHPYSRFSAGSLETLERIPNQAGIDVGARLIDFFQERYQPSQTVLVIMGPQDLGVLERLLLQVSAVLSDSLSRVRPLQVNDDDGDDDEGSLATRRKGYPGGFLQGNRLKHLVLYRNGDSGTEKLSFEWTLDLDYGDMMQSGRRYVTATQIGFCLAQILGRRGPGSLYFFLLRRGWVPGGSIGVPRIVVPVEVSRFQIIKLDLTLTIDGLVNRAAVVSAVYDTIQSLRSGNTFALPRELITQYASIAKLQGYLLAPRPPDAIELAVDAQLYSLSGTDNVGSGEWYRFPSPEDRGAVITLRRSVVATFEMMSDPDTAVIIATAGNKAIARSSSALLADSIPPPSSPRWLEESRTGARFYFDDMLRLQARVEQLVLRRLADEEELLPPVFNPLVPTTLRPARVTMNALGTRNANEILVNSVGGKGSDRTGSLRQRSSLVQDDSHWMMLEPVPGQRGLPLAGPPEPTCRCAFVLQLLSSRPARANVRQVAKGELWRISFEMAVMDLAELGAPGGLAYDLSFNKFGLRLTFLGISQNLPSYARRFSRRIVEHHFRLLEGPEMFPFTVTSRAVLAASKTPGLSPQRRRLIVSNLRRSTAYEAATEGIAFLRSCTGGVCFAQGDLLQEEVAALLSDLKDIFSGVTGTGIRESPVFPSIDDLLYTPIWKPRSASPCLLPGVPLVNDFCGRVPR
jgi:insulysin